MRHCGLQDKLVSSLGAVIRGQLELLGWPPPLQSRPGVHELHQPGGQPAPWHGLEDADEQVMRRLHTDMCLVLRSGPALYGKSSFRCCMRFQLQLLRQAGCMIWCGGWLVWYHSMIAGS